MSSGRGGGREGGQAGRGWIPDGLSGLPTVGSEAPLVSEAPSALIQLHSKSLLWNASETQPASPHSLPPPSLGTRDSTFLLGPFSPSLAQTP